MLTFFTIGYEGLTIADFLKKLQSNHIEVFIDVRNNPHSRKRGFSKKALQQSVEGLGIKYVHIPKLGIPSSLRKELGTDKTHKKLLNYYLTDIIPQQTEAIIQLKEVVSNHSRVVLVCFEKDYHICHRHKITEFLERESAIEFNVVHL